MNSKYNTKQKQILINYLKANKNRHLSVAEIADGVKNSGVGKSTVYRKITELCDMGELRRFRGADGKSVVYQYMDSSKDCRNHFHLKCTGCGALQHLDCESVMVLNRHIKEQHGFQVDMGTTVIYGLCSTCSGGNAVRHKCSCGCTEVVK